MRPAWFFNFRYPMFFIDQSQLDCSSFAGFSALSLIIGFSLAFPAKWNKKARACRLIFSAKYKQMQSSLTSSSSILIVLADASRFQPNTVLRRCYGYIPALLSSHASCHVPLISFAAVFLQVVLSLLLAIRLSGAHPNALKPSQNCSVFVHRPLQSYTFNSHLAGSVKFPFSESPLPKNTTKCPWPGLEPGPLALESSAITMRPPWGHHEAPSLGHVRYINILTWLRGFQVKLLYLVLFSLYPSLFWELRDKRNLKNLQFWPGSLGAMLEYWYIERGLFSWKFQILHVV